MKTVVCIHDYVKNGLKFCRGAEYRVDYNRYDGNIYIYTVFGYTNISKRELDKYFW